MLSLPPNVSRISGANPFDIGDLNPGQSRIVNWVISFAASGVYEIEVFASGYRADSGSYTEVRGASFATVRNPLILSLLSPQNISYPNNEVSLNFTLSEPASWIGYSLDNQINVTLVENITLTGLNDGSHILVLYANDTMGKMESAQVAFNIDTAPPLIEILVPQQTKYSDSQVSLNFTLSEPASWIGYSLNSQSNVTINGNTTIRNLNDGNHEVTIYACDNLGHMGTSETVNFTIEDTTPPSILILQPENTTHHTDPTPLIFTVNEQTSWTAYSLDGQTNITITGNTTLTSLNEGSHNIQIFSTDISGNTGNSTLVFFSYELVHDIALNNVSTSKTDCWPSPIVGQGYNISIYLTIENEGSFQETFNVTTFANSTSITNKQVTLSSGETQIFSFTWNTNGTLKGNYIIDATSWPLQNETDISDNHLNSTIILVTIPGDIDADHDVDIFDIVRISGIYGVTDIEPTYEANSDIDDDGDIDIFDVVIAANNYGNTW